MELKNPKQARSPFYDNSDEVGFKEVWRNDEEGIVVIELDSMKRGGGQAAGAPSLKVYMGMAHKKLRKNDIIYYDGEKLNFYAPREAKKRDLIARGAKVGSIMDHISRKFGFIIRYLLKVKYDE